LFKAGCDCGVVFDEEDEFGILAIRLTTSPAVSASPDRSTQKSSDVSPGEEIPSCCATGPDLILQSPKFRPSFAAGKQIQGMVFLRRKEPLRQFSRVRLDLQFWRVDCRIAEFANLNLMYLAPCRHTCRLYIQLKKPFVVASRNRGMQEIV
jgi:hypothetical protein